MSILAPQPAPYHQPHGYRMPINAVFRLIQRFYPSGGVIAPPSARIVSTGFILQNNSIYTSRGTCFFRLKPLFFYFPCPRGGLFSNAHIFLFQSAPLFFPPTHPTINKSILFITKCTEVTSSVFTTFVSGAPPFFILASGGIFYFLSKRPLF